MPGKKGLLAHCLAGTRVLPLLGRVRSSLRADIPILAYHRVWDVADEDSFPFDVELVSASIADFAWQMEYVRLNFNPITFRTLLRIIDGEEQPPPRPVIVTFDDGFDDNYRHAFPILAARDIPATIFIATGYVDSDRTFWFDRLAHLILSAHPQTLHVKGLAEPVPLPAAANARRATLGRLLEHLKQVPNELRLEILRHIDAVLGAGDFALDAQESQPMNWNQVREMAAAGMEFGSHTVTHPILANLGDDDLWFELTESKRVIEQQTGRTVQVIGYPVGGATAFDERVRHMARGAGYRLGASYISGTNLPQNLDHFGLKRLHVERYTSRAYFAAMLNLPEVFQ